MITRQDLAAELRKLADTLLGNYDRRALGSAATVSRSWSAQLADLAAAGDATGTIVRMRGRSLRVLMSSHASARVEIAFEVAGGAPADTAGSTAGAGGGAASAWFPAVPGTALPAPGGGEFMGFRLRLQDGTPASTNKIVIGVDWPWEAGELGRFAQVSNTGGSETLVKAIRASDGAEAYVEAADGTAADRGALGVALWTGAAYVRALASVAGRLAVNLIVGQDGVTAGAGAVAANTPRVTHASDDPAVTALQVMDDWDEADRAKVNVIVGQAGVAADVGVSGADVQRVVGTTTPAAEVTRQDAAAATAELLPANANRKAAVITNLDTAETAYVMPGAAAATATGFPIGPGQSLTLTTTQAINCIRGAAADVPLAVWEESHA